MSKLTDSPHQSHTAPQKITAGWVSIVVCMLFSFIFAVLSLQQATRHYQGQLQSWIAQHTVQTLSQEPKGPLAKEFQVQRKSGQHPIQLYPKLEGLGLKVYVNAIHTTSRLETATTTQKPHANFDKIADITEDKATKNSHKSLQDTQPAIFQSTTYLFDGSTLKQFKDKRWFDAFWSHKTLWQDLHHDYWASADI